MKELTIPQKRYLSKLRLSYLLNRLIHDYKISADEAYIWLMKSRTYELVTNIDSIFYYAAETDLWNILICEYEGRMKDWELRVMYY